METPVDVLALMDEPGAVGCLLQCRVVGIIEGEQGKKKEAERNDRIVAIERVTTDSPTFVTSKIWVKNSYANWKISS
jgi:inorganic pyrophosphatase